MDFVNVFLRIRPLHSTESCLKVISENPAIVHILDRPQSSYCFDNIFKENVEQQQVYDNTVKPLVDLVKTGFNCTVLAYGQTGSGKTYTVGTKPQITNSKDIGLIERALDDFFNNNCADIEIRVSFIEIYNDKVFDLLKIDMQRPLIVKGGKIQGFSQEKVCNRYEAKHFLHLGNKNRHTAETKQNPNSSRSHAIFTIHYTTRSGENDVCAKLNLVDLAGSESVKKTGNQGNTFYEGVNINKGLFYIGEVIRALSSNKFVNYRQSIITTILQDSLNRNNYVTLIACVNSNADDVHETMQTLEFAQRAKKIKNKPEINEIFNQYKINNPHDFVNMKTPMKKSFITPRKTASKLHEKPINALNSIKESYSDLDFSLTASTIQNSDLILQNQNNFSPVIKKYMNEMETSIMNKIEVVICNTLKKNKRQSEKENIATPNMDWQKVQNELSRLVKTEIAQQTIKLTRATSSPLDAEDESFNKVKKVLNYESPEMKDNEFKIPALPVQKLTTKENPVISPIEATHRRSVRLSLKQSNKICVNCAYTIEDPIKPRRSVRLSIKHQQFNTSVIEDCPPKKIKSTRVENLRKKEKQKATLSPFSNHRKTVLNTLNNGNLKQLERLSTIGIKSAQQILLYRELNGTFDDINDLEKIPGWSDKKVARFLNQNFLQTKGKF